MNAQHLLFSFAIGVGSLVLLGCEDEKKQAEIDELTEQLELTTQDLNSRKERLQSQQEETDELAIENSELKSELRSLKRRAESAESELERLKAREFAAKNVKEREPTSREKLEAAKKTAAEQLTSVVTISGDQTSGSGTLVAADDKVWIYFPASFVGGNSRFEIVTSEGVKLDKFGTFEVAADVDLARLEVKNEVEGALSKMGPSELESGLSVLGIGESDTIVESRVAGITAEKLSNGSRFNQSALGTPIFTAESAELLGIVIAAGNAEPSLWPQRVNSYETHEACRLDRAIKWTPIQITDFMEEAKTLATADRFTRLVFAFAATRPSSTGIDTNAQAGPSVAVSEILEQNKQLAAVRSLFEVNEWLKERGERAAKADLNRRISGVYDDLLRTSTRRTAKLAATRFSPYHAKAATQSLEWREESEKKLSGVAKSFE
ncbi:hypothetical protein [Haloferula sp.]|uniref:hypothetical protein n=1 Tax=Haloferula sp. TaxID=2497595 RepID=UPI003C728476